MFASIQQADGGKREWSIERDRYVVLLHLYNVRGVEPANSLSAERIMRDLGFSAERTELLLTGLIRADLLQYSGFSEGLVLTARGVNYIENEAGRRRSVRLIP